MRRSQFREFDRINQLKEEEDAELLAEKFRQQYSRNDYAENQGFELQDEAVQRKVRVPTILDPKLWSIKCKLGKERDLIIAVTRRNFNNSSKIDTKSYILSAFCRESSTGYIYVEAWNPQAVQNSLVNIQGIYLATMQLVPVGEMQATLTIQKQIVNLREKAWVRCKRGRYAGDLGRIEHILTTGDSAVVQLLPRIDINETEGSFDEPEIPKKGKRKLKARPPQRLLNAETLV